MVRLLHQAHFGAKGGLPTFAAMIASDQLREQTGFRGLKEISNLRRGLIERYAPLQPLVDIASTRDQERILGAPNRQVIGTIAERGACLRAAKTAPCVSPSP